MEHRHLHPSLVHLILPTPAYSVQVTGMPWEHTRRATSMMLSGTSSQCRTLEMIPDSRAGPELMLTMKEARCSLASRVIDYHLQAWARSQRAMRTTRMET